MSDPYINFVNESANHYVTSSVLSCSVSATMSRIQAQETHITPVCIYFPLHICCDMPQSCCLDKNLWMWLRPCSLRMRKTHILQRECIIPRQTYYHLLDDSCWVGAGQVVRGGLWNAAENGNSFGVCTGSSSVTVVTLTSYKKVKGSGDLEQIVLFSSG